MISVKAVLFLAVVCQVTCSHLGPLERASDSGCTIDLVKRLAVHGTPPIFYSLKSGEILYPVDRRKLDIENGQEVGIFCHATVGIETVIVIKGVKQATTLVKVKCRNGVFEDMETKKGVNVANVACTGQNFEPMVNILSDSEPCAKVGVDGRSDVNGQLLHVQIGWEIPEFGFRPQIDLCVDNKEFGTVWTTHNVMPGLGHRDHRKGPDFRSDVKQKRRFFSGASTATLNDVYRKKNQVLVFKDYLNNNHLMDGSDIIDIQKGSSDWFARGHLSPDAAFIYDFEQFATYFYINVAPQFQSFNNGNWGIVEDKTHDLAKKIKRPLRVMQGPSHTLQYRNSKGHQTDVELYYIKVPGKHQHNINVTIPCNKYFWKVIHDVEKNEAIAFVGINDPHYDITVKGDRDRLFKDVTSLCDQLDWVGDTWKLDRVSYGKTICASVEDVFNNGEMDNFPDLSDGNNNWPAALIKTKG